MFLYFKDTKSVYMCITGNSYNSGKLCHQNYDTTCHNSKNNVLDAITNVTMNEVSPSTMANYMANLYCIN